MVFIIKNSNDISSCIISSNSYYFGTYNGSIFNWVKHDPSSDMSASVFMPGETVHDFVNQSRGREIKFALAAAGAPPDAPMQAEGFYEVVAANGYGDGRKIVLFKSYGGYSRIFYRCWYSGYPDGWNGDWMEIINQIRFRELLAGTWCNDLNAVSSSEPSYCFWTNYDTLNSPYKNGLTNNDSAGIVLGFNVNGCGIQLHLTSGNNGYIHTRIKNNNGWTKFNKILKSTPSDESYIVPISCDCSKISADNNGYYIFQIEVPNVLNTYCDVVATLQNVSNTFAFNISNIFSRIVASDKNYIEIRFKTDCVQTYTFNCLVAPKKSFDYIVNL